jgi:hypothetical protein
MASDHTTSVEVVVELEDLLDDRRRPRSMSLREDWGSTDVDGQRVEFFRSLNGLSVEIQFERPSGRGQYRFSLMPVLEACISAALATTPEGSE